VVTWRRR
jgi:transposase